MPKHLVLATTIVLAAAPALAKDMVTVVVDRAKVIRIATPADTVIVGNPAIADATILQRQTIVITGKIAGTTNLVILDGKGQPIADEVLIVERPQTGHVTIQRGGGLGRFTYLCTPECNATIEPGDSKDYFAESDKQIQARGAFGTTPEK